MLPSRHVLIVSDSCYSGGLSRDADAPEHAGTQSAFIARMLKSRSRTLMASGGDEPVSDSGSNGHSVFAYAVLRALERDDQPVFTASDLFYGSIRQQVAGRSSQLPQYTIIRNSDHDEGDFVFMHKTALVSSAADVPMKATLTPLDSFNRGEELIKENRYGDAVPLMTTACDKGNADGCAALGLMYQNGQGVARDDFKATSLYHKACDGGNARGCDLRKWLAKTGAKTLYIEPGSPWKNGYCESFNSKLRDEFLNGEVFYSLKEVQVLAERWRVYYNTERLHSSLGYRPPAPQAWQPEASLGYRKVESKQRFPLFHAPDYV